MNIKAMKPPAVPDGFQKGIAGQATYALFSGAMKP